MNRIVVVALLSTAALCAPVVAEPPDIERFLRIRTPAEASVAPDGTLYVRDWPDGVWQLYRVDGPIASPTAEMTRLTNFPDGLSGFEIAPDGSRILLMHQVGGNENMQISMLYPGDPHDPEAIVPVLSDPSVRYGFQFWLADSSGFVYSANDVSPNDFAIHRFDFARGRDPGPGRVGHSTKLVSEPGSWGASDITRDATRALVGRFRSISDSTILELDVRTRTLTDLTPESPEGGTVWASAVGYLPDERSFLFVSDFEDGTRRLYRRDLDTGTISSPLSDLTQFEVDSVTMSRARDLLAVMTNEEGYRVARLYRLPDFAPIMLPQMERGMVTVTEFFRSGEGTDATIVTLANARTPWIAYEMRIEGQHARLERRLTRPDDQGIDLASFRLPELISYPGFDGMQIPAFLFLPADFEPGTPIPFVVNYHGGPESQFRPGFNVLVQYLVAHGFGVMQPNVRGSAGYGRAFHMLDNYKGRWDSVRDGVDAAEWLVANGLATPGRIATWGGSYGGYMSMATLVEDSKRVERGEREERLFGAGVNLVGIVNFITFLERTAGYRRQLREAEYGPLSDPEFLRSVSPLTHVDRIQVPVFIVHGFNDPRVPVDEAMQIAIALRDRGLDPWLFIAPDEGHSLSKLENRLYYGRRLSAFLRMHLN